ncbi:outer dynein arm-docking complex subunit 4 isoform X2 [Rhinoraja longicauda]
MADDDDEVVVGHVCSYLTYKSEGDRLYMRGEYDKAIQSYTHALQQEPKNKNCLVARSRCYLMVGNTTAALNDAEASQMGKKDFYRGVYRKAESLYAKGEFELALIFYHRGQKLRPDDHLFRLGIQKAREAIDNSVGSPSSVRLETKGDLSFFYRREEKPVPKTKSQLRRQKLNLKQQQQKKQEQEEPKTNKTVKELLGELYGDKEYLEKLLQDKELVRTNADSGGTVQDMIMGGISFLDTRTEFWRQQKPIFAREREQRMKEQNWKSHRETEETIFILKKMLEIDVLFADGLAQECKKMATELVSTVRGWSERERSPNKVEFLAHLYSTIGNAQVELGDVDGALKNYDKDLNISRKYDNKLGKSRALDNLGRVYARTGDFEKAAEVWIEKEPLAKNNLERTWLFHEIGRSYLELGNSEGAQEYGLKSLASAEKAGDEEWKMNANVLVAQAEFKLSNLQTAVTFFEKALGKATLLNDAAAQEAITNAMGNIRGDMELAKMAKEADLELLREKQRAGMRDVSPVYIERVKTEKPDPDIKRGVGFREAEPPPEKVEEAGESPGSEGGSSCSEGTTVGETSKSEENIECEGSLASTSSDSVCLLPSASSGHPSGSSSGQDPAPHAPRTSREDGEWNKTDISVAEEQTGGTTENEGSVSEEKKVQNDVTDASIKQAAPEEETAPEVAKKDQAEEETVGETGQEEGVEEEDKETEEEEDKGTEEEEEKAEVEDAEKDEVTEEDEKDEEEDVGNEEEDEEGVPEGAGALGTEEPKEVLNI